MVFEPEDLLKVHVVLKVYRTLKTDHNTPKPLRRPPPAPNTPCIEPARNPVPSLPIVYRYIEPFKGAHDPRLEGNWNRVEDSKFMAAVSGLRSYKNIGVLIDYLYCFGEFLIETIV